MRTFQDTTGQGWSLEITVGTVKRVREATGVLLAGIFDEKCKPLADLSRDPVLLCDVLWTICRNQAGDVTAEQFAERLGGDSFGQAGEALVRAVADFFSSPEQRTAAHRMLDLMASASTELIGNLTATIQAIDPASLAESCWPCATNLPESPALTPTPEPQVNCA